MEDRPRFQTGPREIRPSGIIGGPRETWPGWNCAPTSHTEWARMVTLHLYTGAPELYPDNPCPEVGKIWQEPISPKNEELSGKQFGADGCSRQTRVGRGVSCLSRKCNANFRKRRQ